jgi:glycine oxidase
MPVAGIGPGMLIAVIGAGAVGLATALELSRAGARVQVYADPAARPASWAAGGLLMPIYPWSQPPALEALAESCMAVYPEWVAGLRAAGGVDADWRRNGLLVLDVAQAEAAEAWARRTRRRLERLDGERVLQVEPAAAASEALWVADCAQVRNPRLLKALEAALAARGVAVEARDAVTGIAVEDGWLRGIRTVSGVHPAEAVVVCAGAWSGALAPEIAPPPVRPVRGQMLLYQPGSGAPVRSILGDGRYLIPRDDGLVLCGSTVEEVGFDDTTTADAAVRLAEAAASLAPVLASHRPIRQWSGLRSATADGLPFIGAHPEMAGLYFNTGQFRNGILFAPVSARLIADLVLDREPCLDPAPFRLAGRGAAVCPG